jgi:hypothetical protein
MPQHSANEQYLLELINAERAKVGAQPLAFDNDLSEAAEGHSRWMLATDVFSHTGSGGSSPTTRMKNAGYVLEGSWATGENIAWATTRAPTGYADEVKLLHTNLMNSSGHRANILNPNFREIGLGFEVGDYKGRTSAFVTENFAKTGTALFLTGVAFDDKDGDRFYDPGEGMGGITVTAKSSTGLTYKTTTMTAGGYDLALKAGTYTVTFSGPGIQTSTQSVTIGTKNVKRDLVDPVMTSGTLSATSTQEPVSDTSPQAQPVSEPAAVPTGQNRWYGDSLAKWQAGRTLSFNEEGEGSGGRPKAVATFLEGDSIAFHAKRPIASPEGSDFARHHERLSERLADIWASVEEVLPKGVDHDAGQALAVKIMADFSAAQNHLQADLAV